jgi:hypothetical protein
VKQALHSKLFSMKSLAGVAIATLSLNCMGAALAQDPAPDASQPPDVSDLQEAPWDARPPPPQLADMEQISRMQAFIAENQVREGITKTFRTPEGDVVDCVETAMQPALRQPAMAGHVLQLTPRNLPVQQPDQVQEGRRSTPAVQSYLRGETCLEGTVPIMRLSIETLSRFRSLDDFLNKSPNETLPIRPPHSTGEARPELGATDEHQYATVTRFVDNRGSESVLNLWRPFTERDDEFSLSQIWVSRGAGDDQETVEAGWQQFRQKYGDWNSRLFIFFTPDNYRKKDPGGCYNLECKKFVQTNNTVLIGGAFDKYSQFDGEQRVIKLLWFKDGQEGHWWLRYFDTWAGYYPRELFDRNGLQDIGGRVTYGGEIINDEPDGRHTRTDMGSGHWPPEQFRHAAYQHGLRYVDTSNFYQGATSLTPIVTDPLCYDLAQGSSRGTWEEYIYFGGSGFNTQCE